MKRLGATSRILVRAITILVVASVVVAAFAPASYAQSDVTIQNNAFSPNSLTVPTDTTVTWTNKDNTDHTVTSDSGGVFDSGHIASGKSYSFKFTQSGTYNYHCSIHTNMTASIIVVAATKTTPAPATPPTSTPTTGGISFTGILILSGIAGLALYNWQLRRRLRRPQNE